MAFRTPCVWLSAAFFVLSGISYSLSHAPVACSGYARNGALSRITVAHGKLEVSVTPPGQESFSLTMNSVHTSDVCSMFFSLDSRVAAAVLYNTENVTEPGYLLLLDVEHHQWISTRPARLDVQIPPPVVVTGFFQDTHQVLVSAAHPFVRDGHATIFPELVGIAPDGENVTVSSDVRSVPAPSAPIFYLDAQRNRLWFSAANDCSLKSESLFGDLQYGARIDADNIAAAGCNTPHDVLFPDENSAVFVSQRGDDVVLYKMNLQNGSVDTLPLTHPEHVSYWLFPGTFTSPDGRWIGITLGEVNHGTISTHYEGPFVAVVEAHDFRLSRIVRVSGHDAAATASLGDDATVTYFNGKSWESKTVEAGKDGGNHR
ncbi:MAG TPA: hypothetical protein VGL89_12525 [Candidatus Koribacter sp.]|jgi:hypothetical protein